ncbi:serine/threonine-protein kinase [Actinopolymorpha rutila]|uniref:non-specific serine/threonine protein kinase n=1 Tax=Actinopolymorpha rutila TaxID=446787 RepID=A0A852ZLD2_9ACTN|nr:serine/threonine-protein kinase [Actinopolymorpha rutila]NYH92698.1 serine/threonine protein kinase [Actinopolymorpha rutila]
MSENDRLIAGRYRLEEQIGSGGMGVVWRGVDERLHRPVAVKRLLLPAYLTGTQAEEAKLRAMRESRIAARIQHPHVIATYDVVEDDGHPCLVMEYLPSRSLSEVLEERGSLPAAEVASIGRQAASALASAHAAGVVHRDIKPGNVLLGDNGVVKIADFGIARAVGDVTVTATGLISGTPAYLAPEVAKGEDATFASDVFSLGSTLYAAVEGGPPFGRSENPIALLHQVASAQVAPPRRAPRPLADVLQRVLRADPRHRPPASAVARELAAAAARLSAAPDRGEDANTTRRFDTPVAVPGGADAPSATGPGAAGAVGAAGAAAAADAGRSDFSQRTPSTPYPPETSEPSAVGPGGAGGDSRRRRFGAVVAAVIAVVLIAGLGAAFLLDRRDKPDGGPVAGATTDPATPRSTPTPTSKSPSPTPTTKSPSPTPTTKSPSPTPTPTPTKTRKSPKPKPPKKKPSQSRGGAVSSYYSMLPENIAGGWSQLTPRYQSKAGGYDGYRRFWGRMSDVSASDVRTSGNVVRARITYHLKSGGTERERRSFTMVQRNGRWMIDASSVI